MSETILAIVNKQIEMAKYNTNSQGMLHPNDRKDIDTSLEEIDNQMNNLKQARSNLYSFLRTKGDNKKPYS